MDERLGIYSANELKCRSDCSGTITWRSGILSGCWGKTVWSESCVCHFSALFVLPQRAAEPKAWLTPACRCAPLKWARKRQPPTLTHTEYVSSTSAKSLSVLQVWQVYLGTVFWPGRLQFCGVNWPSMLQLAVDSLGLTDPPTPTPPSTPHACTPWGIRPSLLIGPIND